MNKKISAYQTLSNLKKEDNLIVNVLTTLISLIKDGTNPEYDRVLRVKALSNLSALCNYTVEHLNYNENKELATLVKDTLIVLEDKAIQEILNEKNQNFDNIINHLNHFSKISKI